MSIKLTTHEYGIALSCILTTILSLNLELTRIKDKYGCKTPKYKSYLEAMERDFEVAKKIYSQIGDNELSEGLQLSIDGMFISAKIAIEKLQD